ncbi:hypothetical protein ACAG25_02305 [Mycobacterium sp. pV006]|uniref:hypothetical protein n=1 Tax=Mycobacterium sp. pV006 TaxID=3238983 RepID=UPI00351BD100
MPSFRRRESVIDTDRAGSSPAAERVDDAQRARALAEEAEAEAAEAEARAAAARARAKAIRLRQEAEAVEATEAPEATEAADAPEATESGDDVDDAASEDHIPGEEGAGSRRHRRLPRPNWKAVAASLVVVAILALLGLSGFMVWQHRQAEELRQQNAEYAAAARQSVVTLMSLDFNNAEADVQRIIDNSTGQFKSDFEQQAKDFVKVAQDSKVVTEVTVNSTAVQEMDDETAEVLVAASSRVTNTAGADGDIRTWRLSVSLQKEDGQIKMAKVEFVP